MSSAEISPDLQQALEQLSSADPAPECFELVARWRRACGDAEAAATWQTWSLLPPEAEELRQALAQLWRNLGDTQRAAALLPEPGWQQLAVMLQQGELEQATNLQRQLLQERPPLEVAALLELVNLWQEAEQHQQALELLEPLLGWMERRGEPVSGQLCNAMADLLEKQERFNEAEPWWQRSHALQPHQAWPLMRLGHQAMRLGQPLVAVHYANQVLQRDPSHAIAPRLQRKALQALGASRSLALLDGTALPVPVEAAPLLEPPAAEIWQGCRRLALLGFRDAAILEGWLETLEQNLPATSGQPLQLWLIASPDPLWLHQQVHKRLVPFAVAIALESWPVWDPQRHGNADRVLQASETPPFWQLIQHAGA